ncbi:hypothetical protein Zmor_023954 [Zophobas morio]|uniref:Uncharacterized protein n=1 Tax=Zophobas morio TaxID=2755281 RepID=A0AA38I475_9CUCU|nr:hypothetical protein Zmor_023954 [Zophobas morio]
MLPYYVNAPRTGAIKLNSPPFPYQNTCTSLGNPNYLRNVWLSGEFLPVPTNTRIGQADASGVCQSGHILPFSRLLHRPPPPGSAPLSSSPVLLSPQQQWENDDSSDADRGNSGLPGCGSTVSINRAINRRLREHTGGG